ncbi:MAG: lytic murein transglycosylase [Pseudomonadota bacterium]
MGHDLKRFSTWRRALGTAAIITAMNAMTTPASAQEPSFSDWLEAFRSEAAAAGIDQNVVTQAFEGVTVNERVFELNDNQPEFSQTIWNYLDSALSTNRIEKGRTRFAQNKTLLAQIEDKYGVDAETIVAIWGLESSYGDIMGSYDAVQALATLAWQGRRTAYGRSQLIGLLKIIQNGYAARDELKGSWAGAMGHTQFIPTTYLSHAIDENADGRRDIWSSLEDVFASTANYLSVSGYNRDTGWGLEITLPEEFDYDLAAPSTRKPVAEWAALGVDAASGNLIGRFDPNRRGRIIVPAGAKGPAFLVFRNFEAILKYNRSTSYALAVSLLSEQVAGSGGTLAKEWPRADRALSLSERKSLQQALIDKGFDPGPVDGVVGAGTRAALKAWQKSAGVPADGYASADTLLRLTAE